MWGYESGILPSLGHLSRFQHKVLKWTELPTFAWKNFGPAPEIGTLRRAASICKKLYVLPIHHIFVVLHIPVWSPRLHVELIPSFETAKIPQITRKELGLALTSVTGEFPTMA